MRRIFTQQVAWALNPQRATSRVTFGVELLKWALFGLAMWALMGVADQWPQAWAESLWYGVLIFTDVWFAMLLVIVARRCHGVGWSGAWAAMMLMLPLSAVLIVLLLVWPTRIDHQGTVNIPLQSV